ncbi:MAG: GTP-binding protein [Patescibacteria group bacterium]|nr:GTP-binding protein [Patescibacteria group bacterium]
MPNKPKPAKFELIFVGVVAVVLVAIAIAFLVMPSRQVSFSPTAISANASTTLASTTSVSTALASTTPPFQVTHIPTPDYVHAVYYTSWAAGTPSFQKEMSDLLAEPHTQLNAIVIDVKDYSGRIGYIVNDPRFKDATIDSIGSAENRIPDIEHFVAALHAKGIYVIGRIQDFEDPFALKTHPEWYVKKANGTLWKDAGGAYWIDPDNKESWKYLVAIAKQAYNVGFDEINFDYVRFPSDGSVDSAVYDKSASTTKESVITDFFSYLHSELSPLGIPISADVFGQTTTDTGDMGIGQHFENVLPYFDYVDPMVYPSHYIKNYDGFDNPAAHPYGIVKYAMDTAVTRAIDASFSPSKIRPWLQAFDLGATYTPDMVKAQIQATADAGLGSWLLWNAGSVYSKYINILSLPAPTVAEATTSRS